MAQTILLKRRTSDATAPSASDLTTGEVAVNAYSGKLYIKKTDGTVTEVSGSGGGGSSFPAVYNTYKYTATNGQTTFVGNDSSSNLLTYNVGNLIVFLNGVLLVPTTDYVATTGNTVVLQDGATTNDILTIVAFTATIGDGNVAVDTFSGDGSTTAFTLAANPQNENNTQVFIDGIYQSKSNYAVSGTTLTFSTAPPNNTSIEVTTGSREVTQYTATTLSLPNAGMSITGGDLDIPSDSRKIKLGASNDLQIFHDGTNNYIQGGTGDLRIDAKSGERGIVVTPDGATTLYHDNAAKIATASGGVTITGTATATTFVGALTGNVTGNASGNAGTATALANARTIGGTSFDGTANIAVNLAATATALANARTIGGTSFDGTANIVPATAVAVTGAAQSAITSVGTLSALSISGDLTIADKIIHSGDTDTFFRFAGANDIRIVAGNVEHAAFDVNTIVFNQSGANMDFRVESTGNASMLHVDAGNDRVGIGTNAPDGGALHVKAGASGASSFDSRYNFILEDSGENYIGIYTPSNSYGGIRFVNAANSIRGAIDYYHGTQGDKLQVYAQTEVEFTFPSVGEQVTFKSGGSSDPIKVGIGETSPLGRLHIKENDSGASSVNSNFDQLVLEDDLHSGMTILSGTSGDGAIYFGDSGTNDIGQIKYKHSTNALDFTTNSSIAMRIDSSGIVHVGPTQQARMFITSSDRFNLATDDGLGIQLDKDNNRIAPVDASGSYNNNVSLGSSSLPFKDLHIDRIYFNETAGSGATSSALDSYEEGSWTPILKDGGSTTLTITINQATYTKIGRFVMVSAYIHRNDSASLTGYLAVTNLPFTVKSGDTNLNGGIWFDGTGTDLVVSCYLPGGNTIAYPKKVGDNSDYATTNQFQNGRPLYMSAMYHV